MNFKSDAQRKAIFAKLLNIGHNNQFVNVFSKGYSYYDVNIQSPEVGIHDDIFTFDPFIINDAEIGSVPSENMNVIYNHEFHGGKGQFITPEIRREQNKRYIETYMNKLSPEEKKEFFDKNRERNREYSVIKREKMRQDGTWDIFLEKNRNNLKETYHKIKSEEPEKYRELLDSKRSYIDINDIIHPPVKELMKYAGDI